MSGRLIISLDFELHWGGFDKWPLEHHRRRLLNTRAVIPEMLRLFSVHGIHVTWATVGMLFFDNRDDLLEGLPALRPQYVNNNLSAYHFIEQQGIGKNEEEDPFHFGRSLLVKISDTPNQEIASHSFSHYYCNEEGQSVEQFHADLTAAKRAAASLGVALHSLVFPRNQFNRLYLDVCRDEGITAVRSNPATWFWEIGSTQNESWWKRLNRGMDAYFSNGQTTSYSTDKLGVDEGQLVVVPASRLLRPYRKEEKFLNRLKLNRIVAEMRHAAKVGDIYHLWWHPHNFGDYPLENLRMLESILAAFAECRRDFGMQSLTMSELAHSVRKTHGNQATA